MSARRFRHRDRQQVRPGLPQLRPGLEAHCPASGFGNPAFCAPTHRRQALRTPSRIRFGNQRYGTPRASGARHPAHAGHWRQAHRAPGCIRFGNQVSRVPDIRRCRASCVGHEKVGHEKGESGIGFPFGRPLLCPHPGRRGYFFSGRAIDSRIDVSAMMFFIL